MSEHVRSQEEIAARVKALESILIEKGVMTTAAIDRLVEIYENEVGPQLGAKVVARAWKDPEFKQRLLADATQACAEFGIGGLQGEDMVVVENTADVHNVIVCTLVLVLPVAGARPAAELVQGAGLPRRGSSRRRARCYARTSATTCPTRSRCGSGTPARKCATGCCPSGRRGRAGSARPNWPAW